MIFRRKVAKSCTFHDLRQKWHESSKSGRKLQSHTKSAKSCGRCPKKSHEICEKLRKVPEKVTRNLRKVAAILRKVAQKCNDLAKSPQSSPSRRFLPKSAKSPQSSPKLSKSHFRVNSARHSLAEDTADSSRRFSQSHGSFFKKVSY
jgi:hypothetical protein